MRLPFCLLVLSTLLVTSACSSQDPNRVNWNNMRYDKASLSDTGCSVTNISACHYASRSYFYDRDDTRF